MTVEFKDCFGTRFKPTHKVVAPQNDTFNFYVGTLLRHIGDGYYKDKFGNIKWLGSSVVEEIV